MKCMYKIIIPMMICVASLNAMHDDADEWLNAAQRAYEKTEGVQLVNEENEVQENFEKCEQTESFTQEYNEATFDEDDPSTWFSECPAQSKKLSCEYFKGKRCWQRAVSLPQERKNGILFSTKNCVGSRGYPLGRCKIAGWVCAGADLITSDIVEQPLTNDDYWLMKILLEHKFNANERLWMGRVPLWVARTKNMAKLLVLHGAETNWKTDNGTTLLHAAAMRTERSDLLEYYIQQKVPINSVTRDGETALHHLSEWGILDSCEEFLKKARLLLKAGIDIDAKDKDGRTAQDLLQECPVGRWSVSAEKHCKLLYGLIEEERTNRLKQLQKNGGDHGIHV
jgi:hypothetical protein